MSGISSTWNFKNVNLDFKAFIRDEAADNIKYYGAAYKYNCSEAEPLWLIWREVRLTSGIYRRDFAEGNVAFDKIWNNRATYFGGVVGSTFQNTYSLQFDGVNDYLTNFVPEMDRDSNVAFSLGMWVNPADTGTTVRTLFTNYSTRGKTIFTSSGQVTVNLFSSSTTGLAVRSGIILAVGVWTYVLITYDGSGTIGGLKIYANGVESAPTTVLNNISGTIISGSIAQIGAQTAVGTRYFPGYIDECSVWNRALTPAEALTLYNGGKPLDLNSLASKANLVHWWRMGDGDLFPNILDSGYVGPLVTLSAQNMVAASVTPIVP